MAMTETEAAHQKRLTEDLKSLRDYSQSKTQQLAEAEAALRFYANPTNYTAREIVIQKVTFQDLVKDDFTTADNDTRTHIAGRRARRYFSLYET